MAKEAAKAPSKGIAAQGRSATYKRRGLWKIKEKNGGKFPQTAKKAKESVPDPKAPRFYPADDEKKHTNKRLAKHAPGLRASITPGTVLILLAGRFRGKRVVFLKQLPSGLLLVTGPFSINGVPLRRVNQAYVIATSTKIALPELDLATYDDKHFKGEAKVRGEKKTEDNFFKAKEEKKTLPAEVVEGQKKVDAALTKALDETMKGYLGARFTLQAGARPHLMKF